MGILSSIADALTLGLASPSQAGTTATTEDLAIMGRKIQDGFIAVDRVFAEANDQAAKAITQAQDARIDIRHVGNDVKLITQHTYDVVIPNSLAWVEGDIDRRILKPIRNRLASFKRQIDFLLGWRGQIIFWRNKYVDPTLTRYIAFEKYFYGSPKITLDTWVGYFAHPFKFATDWIPFIGPTFIGWLGKASSQQYQNALTLQIVNTLTDVERPAWDALLRFMVTSQ